MHPVETRRLFGRGPKVAKWLRLLAAATGLLGVVTIVSHVLAEDAGLDGLLPVLMFAASVAAAALGIALAQSRPVGSARLIALSAMPISATYGFGVIPMAYFTWFALHGSVEMWMVFPILAGLIATSTLWGGLRVAWARSP